MGKSKVKLLATDEAESIDQQGGETAGTFSFSGRDQVTHGSDGRIHDNDKPSTPRGVAKATVTRVIKSVVCEKQSKKRPNLSPGCRIL